MIIIKKYLFFVILIKTIKYQFKAAPVCFSARLGNSISYLNSAGSGADNLSILSGGGDSREM